MREGCTGNIIICADELFGIWCYCPCCGFAGDALQLFALQENITIEKALQLRDPYMPEYIDKQLARKYYEEWEEIGLLANLRRRWNPKYMPAYETLHKYNMDTEDYAPISRILSVMPAKYLRAMGLSSATFTKHNNMVIPCFDAPGRLAGVIHLNAEESPSVIHLKHSYTKDSECGVAFLNDVMKMQDIETLYIMSDALTATRLQGWYYDVTGRLLPLLIRMPESGTAYSKWLRPRRVVMILDTVIHNDIDVALTMRGQGAEVYIAPARDMWCPEPTGAYSPTEGTILAAAGANGTPVMKFLQQCSGDARAALPFDIAISKEHAAELAKISTPSDAVQEHTKSCGIKTVKIGRRTYEERENGIFQVMRHDVRMISNVKVVPEYAVTVTGTTDTIYTGKLIYRNKSAPFAMPPSSLRRAGNDWIRNALSAAGMDVVNVAIEPSSASLIYLIGEELYKPGALEVPPIARTFEKLKRVTLPHVQVTGSGIEDVYLKSYYPSAPCRFIQAGWEPDKEELAGLLGANPTNEVFWATMVYMIATLMAPYYGVQPKALVMYGGAHNMLDWFVSAFNLATWDIPRNDARRLYNKFPGADYGLPTRMVTPYSAGAFKHLVEGKQMYITEGAHAVADALVARGGWLSLDARGCGRIQATLTLCNIAGCVIHSLLAKRYSVPDDLIKHVAGVTHDWLNAQGIKGQLTVLKCIDRLSDTTATGDSVIAALVTHIFIDYFKECITHTELCTIMKKSDKYLWLHVADMPHIHYYAYKVPRNALRTMWLNNMSNVKFREGGVLCLPRKWAEDRFNRAKAIMKKTDPDIFQQRCNITLDDIKSEDG